MVADGVVDALLEVVKPASKVSERRTD